MLEFSIPQLIVATLNGVFFYVTLWFLISLLVNRNDVADLAWGLGITFVAMLCFLAVHTYDVRIAIMAGLTFMWGTRLTLHITERYLRSGGEDYRYQAWRRAWQPWFMPRSYTQVFLLQGLLMVVIGYPFIHAAHYAGEPWGVLETFGIMVWLLGFTLEAVADRQLRTFLRNPANRGSICSTGLWGISRHPNYLGEALIWWGIGIMALGTPWGIIALIGPLTITFLLRFVSGVPLLEKKAMKNAAYKAYAEQVPVFVPTLRSLSRLWKPREQGTIERT